MSKKPCPFADDGTTPESPKGGRWTIPEREVDSGRVTLSLVIRYLHSKAGTPQNLAFVTRLVVGTRGKS
ncbi:hypothetical protein EHS25_004730 [Saitozyma podzolica]|uniref:Uncharacterized protein n=1 Tax=Saitozyma podzolica TaxID=1890683 RepID=A0A427Y2H6_9TREE|nr:hypothetical protein EHS25_004730 [Saitozyma podzolica]